MRRQMALILTILSGFLLAQKIMADSTFNVTNYQDIQRANNYIASLGNGTTEKVIINIKNDIYIEEKEMPTYDNGIIYFHEKSNPYLTIDIEGNNCTLSLKSKNPMYHAITIFRFNGIVNINRLKFDCSTLAGSPIAASCCCNLVELKECSFNHCNTEKAGIPGDNNAVAIYGPIDDSDSNIKITSCNFDSNSEIANAKPALRPFAL